ncbi:hypothetical protein MA16_Dca018827 [Dendrobium catenatum]|uniref:Origin recognition complex subunit 4 C-terminal domain-containing protein n=1 Tax=Dendrobium catenatum TaxID=906689 RepID=A0A2I0X426_9ASPA|nr:hypothetical protein MA16_Dca018827 [Dendrobium catenatum]
MASEKALDCLRRRLCDSSFVYSAFKSTPAGNYSKLKFLISNTITEACNNSVLLLGPRGCGKGAVVDMILEELKDEFPEIISVVRLNGLLHSDDNFAVKGKQRLLYSLLDAMQTLTSQSVVIGISCRLNILGDKKFKEILDVLSSVDNTISNICRFLYHAISWMHFESGSLTLDGFKNALSCMQRQPMLDKLQGASVLEFYILVCMNRLGSREQNSFNFNSIMKEYKAIQDAYKTSDNYSWSVCLRAFEHLIERELISFLDNRMRSLSIEYRPVRLLLSSQELHQGLKSNSFCPVSNINY